MWCSTMHTKMSLKQSVKRNSNMSLNTFFTFTVARLSSRQCFRDEGDTIVRHKGVAIWTWQRLCSFSPVVSHSSRRHLLLKFYRKKLVIFIRIVLLSQIYFPLSEAFLIPFTFTVKHAMYVSYVAMHLAPFL